MKLKTWVTLAIAVAAVAGCDKHEESVQNAPAYNTPITAPPSQAPRPPDAGTYAGPGRGSDRPPASGLNSDPRNPSGAPGTYSPTNMGTRF
jgi:hypothetical protein